MKPGDHPDFFRFPAPEGRSRESTIRLDREGRFWHDGEPVDHERLATAMHGWLTRHPDDGRYILSNGYDWTYLTVDDAPFVVRSVRFDEGEPSAPSAPSDAAAGDGGDARAAPRAWLRLSNGDEVELDARGVTEGDDGALYARVTVKGQVFEARFSRHAQAQLGPALVEVEGRVGLRAGGEIVVPGPRRAAQGGSW